MKIKKGDKVQMLTGKDKGKTGKVLQVLSGEKKAVVEGLNLILKNQRPKKQGEKGQRIQFPSPVDLGKVALICPRCGRATRVGYQTTGEHDQKIKARVCKKCKEQI